MKSQALKKQKKKLPDKPGVYLFKDIRGNILYIGKATSLRDRVKSYFNKDVFETRGPMIADMVFKAKKVDFIEADSVLEALILEANLIRKHQPKYNTKEKDNKSFNYVVITDEEFPRIFTMRGRELFGRPTSKKLSTFNFPSPDSPSRRGGQFSTIYGPFPQGSVLKEALKIVRRIFPFRDKRANIKGNETFYRQLGLTPDTRGQSLASKNGGTVPARLKQEYQKTIRNLKLFFEGKKKTLIKNLEKEMQELAKKQEFEKADEIKKQIFALRHIQDVSLIKEQDEHSNILTNVRMFRVEAYDIAHISGKSMVGVMTVVEDSVVQKSQYRKFKILGYETSNDPGALKEILGRRFSHPEWMGPSLIVVDGGKAQKNTAERVLENLDLPIPVIAVVKDEKHRPKNILGDKKLVKKYEKDILLANNEAHRFAITYHRELQRKALKK